MILEITYGWADFVILGVTAMFALGLVLAAFSGEISDYFSGKKGVPAARGIRKSTDRTNRKRCSNAR